AQVEAPVQLATRVSVSLEGPTDDHVRRLAKEKDLSGDLLPKLELAGRLYRQAREEGGPGPRGSTTTQFVVGATGERDREVLGLVARLERQRLLHHAHFSAFQPVAGTPFENLAPTPASTRCAPASISCCAAAGWPPRRRRTSSASSPPASTSRRRRSARRCRPARTAERSILSAQLGQQVRVDLLAHGAAVEAQAA